jgi:hypothetical protein
MVARRKGVISSKRYLQIIGSAVVVFLVIDLIAGWIGPDLWAFDAAAVVCRQNGWQPGDYTAGESSITGGLIGKIATIEFKPRDPSRCKTIRVVLHKPINFFPWKVMEYSEEHDQN